MQVVWAERCAVCTSPILMKAGRPHPAKSKGILTLYSPLWLENGTAERWCPNCKSRLKACFVLVVCNILFFWDTEFGAYINYRLQSSKLTQIIPFRQYSHFALKSAWVTTTENPVGFQMLKHSKFIMGTTKQHTVPHSSPKLTASWSSSSPSHFRRFLQSTHFNTALVSAEHQSLRLHRIGYIFITRGLKICIYI